MIEIIGAKGNVQNIEKFIEETQSFSKENNLIIQSFNADLIYGKDHLISATKHANRAIENKTNTTNSLEMEIILYASGKRQLKLAIPKMGVQKGKSKVAFVIMSRKQDKNKKIIEKFLTKMKLERDDNVLNGNRETLEKFGLNNTEIDTITKDKYGDLILEKVAMVDILK